MRGLIQYNTGFRQHRRYCSSHTHPLAEPAEPAEPARVIDRSITTVGVCVGPNTHIHTPAQMYIAIVVVAAAHGCSVVPIYDCPKRNRTPSHYIGWHNNMARHTTHGTLSTLATLVVVGIYIFRLIFERLPSPLSPPLLIFGYL
jgi:hypothetical protein